MFHELPTEKSFTYNTYRSVHNSSRKNYSEIYQTKMEEHLAFMEKEYIRNINYQRDLIKEIKKNHKKTKELKPFAIINLTLDEENILKEILKEFCSIYHDKLELSELIGLAINVNGLKNSEKNIKNQFVPKSNEITSAFRQIQLKFQRQQLNFKSPQSFMNQGVSFYEKKSEKQHEYLLHSFANSPQDTDKKQIILINGCNYENEKINAFQNLSFAYSQSFKENIQKKEINSIINQTGFTQNCIYLNRKQQATTKLINQQKGPYLQFNANKKRRTTKTKDKKKQNYQINHNSNETTIINEASPLKQMRDSFGKQYYEFPELKNYSKEVESIRNITMNE